MKRGSPDAAGITLRPSPVLFPLTGLAGGVAIANVFYCQPLLATVANVFHVDPAAAATWSTLTQAGFAAGLLFVLPLGDVLDRRRLASALMLIASAALIASASAPNLAVLALAGIAVGLASMVSQLLVALAADMAPDASRGRVVAWVMTGVLLGAQLSRTVAGFLAQAGGWRSVYYTAAVAAALLSALLWVALPSSKTVGAVMYRTVLGSMVRLCVEEPELRLRALYGALAMGAFSTFWTAAAFFLTGRPHHLSVAAIGLFSLAGLAAPGVAFLAGRLGDAGRSSEATGGFAALAVLGFALAALGQHWLPSLAAAAALLTAGTIGLHVISQGVALRLRPGARSRLNAIYMTSFFLGGVAGSAAAGIVFKTGGWFAICALGGGVAAIAGLVWLYQRGLLVGSAPGRAVPAART
ncbi:MAG TPA: MFS transporter [Chloroflexota bacterium]|nr:MFS transporter [Chloroflexota bacterium]